MNSISKNVGCTNTVLLYILIIMILYNILLTQQISNENFGTIPKPKQKLCTIS